MYTDYKNYPNLERLPNELEESLDNLEENKTLRDTFGEKVIASYIKLKKQELESFDKEERFDKRSPITTWERNNTLDC
jgi:glutamine synthetase